MVSTRLLLAALAVSLIFCVAAAQAGAAVSDVRSHQATVLQIGKQALDAQEYRVLALAGLPQDFNPASAADPEFVREFADRLLLVEQARREHLQDDPVVAARIRQATDAILAKAV